jgi:hypothetical protein
MSLAVAARACPCIVFGLSVPSVLDDPRWNKVPRKLDVVELESGVEAVTRAAREKGHRAEAFDKERHPVNEDLLLKGGFHRALELVMRLRPGGLLGQAPDCSTWTGLNMNNTGRRADNREGDVQYKPVVQANFMGEITFFLMCVALARSVHIYVENPPGSMLFNHFRHIIDLFGELLAPHIVHRCAYFSQDVQTLKMKKPYKFLADGKWFQAAVRRCQCPGNEHLQMCKKGSAERRPGQHRRTWTGIKQNLRESQAYPDDLGRAIISAWEQSADVDQTWKSGRPAGPLACPGRDPQTESGPGPGQVQSVPRPLRSRAAKSAMAELERKLDAAGAGGRRPRDTEARAGSISSRPSRRRRKQDDDPWADVDAAEVPQTEGKADEAKADVPSDLDPWDGAGGPESGAEVEDPWGNCPRWD